MKHNPTFRHGFLLAWRATKVFFYAMAEIASVIARHINCFVKRFPWAVIIAVFIIAVMTSIFIYCQSRYEVNTVEHQRDSLYQIIHSYEEAGGYHHD